MFDEKSDGSKAFLVIISIIILVELLIGVIAIIFQKDKSTQNIGQISYKTIYDIKYFQYGEEKLLNMSNDGLGFLTTFENYYFVKGDTFKILKNGTNYTKHFIIDKISSKYIKIKEEMLEFLTDGKFSLEIKDNTITITKY